MFLCVAAGWRVGVRVSDMRDGAFIVANREELAELPLARRNNSTTTVSTWWPICIDALNRALSSDVGMIINLPEFVLFGSQKAGAVGGPNLTHNKATATSVLRKNGCDDNLNGCTGDETDRGFDEKSWCRRAMIDFVGRSSSTFGGLAMFNALTLQSLGRWRNYLRTPNLVRAEPTRHWSEHGTRKWNSPTIIFTKLVISAWNHDLQSEICIWIKYVVGFGSVLVFSDFVLE